MTPPGIDPETLVLVAQCLNHYANSAPPTIVEPEGILPSLSHNIDLALFYIEWLLVITEHTDDEPPLVGCSRLPIQDSVFRVTLHT